MLEETETEPVSQNRIDTAKWHLVGLIMHREGVPYMPTLSTVQQGLVSHMNDFLWGLGLPSLAQFRAECLRYLESQLVIQERSYFN